MDTLSFDNFVDIALNLPPSDLLSLCSSNKQYNKYCHAPDFYYRLILIKYGLRINNATYRDYRFVSELKSVKIIPPDPSRFSTATAYEGVLDKAKQLLDLYVTTELNAYLNGQPLRYFTFPQDQLGEIFNTYGNSRLDGLWFSAYTPEGALLKFKDYYYLAPYYKHNYGDYLSYIVVKSRNFPPNLNIAMLGLTQTQSSPGQPYIINFQPPILVETRRPYLDLDPDGSKAKQAYDNITAGIGNYNIPLVYKPRNGGKLSLSRDERNKLIFNLIASYYQTELNALKAGGMRYFVVRPSLLYQPYRDERRDDFETLSGMVIVAASNEGAILRLADLLPSFRISLIQLAITSYPNESSLIDQLVLTHQQLQQGTITAIYDYLVEISQPQII